MNNSDDYYIDQVLQGNKEAFGGLVNRYKDVVFSLAFRVARDKNHASEIAQTVFIKAYKALPRFKRKARFSSWLYRIAYNTALTEIRNNKNYQITDSLETCREYAEENADKTEKQEKSQYIEEAVNMLNPRDALIITLFYLEGHSVEDVSRQTGLSEANIKVRLHRARKQLYHNLRYLLKDEPSELL